MTRGEGPFLGDVIWSAPFLPAKGATGTEGGRVLRVECQRHKFYFTKDFPEF
jgi:hypothetical protein